MNCFAIPNRRLLSKQVLVGLRPPFDLIAKQKGFCEARPAEGGASEQFSRPEKSLSFDWSGQNKVNNVVSQVVKAIDDRNFVIVAFDMSVLAVE